MLVCFNLANQNSRSHRDYINVPLSNCMIFQNCSFTDMKLQLSYIFCNRSLFLILLFVIQNIVIVYCSNSKSFLREARIIMFYLRFDQDISFRSHVTCALLISISTSTSTTSSTSTTTSNSTSMEVTKRSRSSHDLFYFLSR